MALLEKIRQRKKILAIVIGAALLAFIVEVAIEALGRQANNTTAAKVGSEKIDIMAFQKRVEQVTSQDQQQQNPNIDQAVRQQQVLEEMISEKLFEAEYEEVGIYVTDKEISDLMIGKNPAPAAMQMAQQVGAESPAQLFDFLSNPQKYNAQPEQVRELQAQWDKLTEEMVSQLKLAKLSALVAGGIQANDLDREMMAEEDATTSYITFVKKDFESIDDAKYKVSDEELKAEWAKCKPLFELDDENRRVHFIALSIDPSQADINEANKVADQAYAALQKGTGIDSVRLMGKVKVDTAKVTLDQITNNDLKSFIGGAAIGATKRDSVVGNNHAMYKLTNKTVSLDSVQLTFIGVPGDKKVQDKALADLNGGKTIDDIAKSIKGAQGQADQWVQVANYPDSIKNKIANAGEGFFVLLSNEQGAQIAKVQEKKAPKTFYTVATVTYEAYASSKTSNDMRDKLQNFLNKNKTAAAFAKNAAAAGFQAQEALISTSTPQLGMNPYTGTGVKDSRKAIKWAFENKKGEVSPIFTDNNNAYIAVAIDDIYEDGYMPYDAPEVKKMLETRVRNAKKGDDLMKQYNGKANDLNGYAKVMGVKVDTTQVIFGGNMVPKLETEPGAAGRVVAAKQGQFVGLLKGEGCVYAFQVTKVEKAARKASKEELDQRFAQQRGAGIVSNPQVLSAILGKATKVERHLIDFY